MLDRATGSDLRIPNRQTAEHHDQLRVLRDTLPTGARAIDGVMGPEDIAHQHRAGRVAVGVFRVGEAADSREEAAQLVLRMMKAARARPSIGAAENRAIAVLANHSLEFIGDEIDGALP